jgi:hypothetical protein
MLLLDCTISSLLENDFAIILKRRLPSPLSCLEEADISGISSTGLRHKTEGINMILI